MDKIAIIGMGCLFPEAQSPEQFFDVLMKGRDVTTPLSARELGVDPKFYVHPRPGTPDKIGYHTNGHIRDFRFDPRGIPSWTVPLGITGPDLPVADPCRRAGPR